MTMPLSLNRDFGGAVADDVREKSLGGEGVLDKDVGIKWKMRLLTFYNEQFNTPLQSANHSLTMVLN